jgi:hypothetical protein
MRNFKYTNGSVTDSGAFIYYKYHTPLAQFSQTQIQQTFNFFKMLPDLNYYPDEENYTVEQPSDSIFLTGIFSNHNQTNSYQIYDQTNFYPTYDQTNLYLYPAIYSNNIIYQQPNPVMSLYNFFGGSSSSTSGCNLADNIRRTEKQNNIDGRSIVDPMIMKLSDDHDDQDEQDDGGPYYSNEEKTGEDYSEQSDFLIDESEDEEIQRCDTTLLVTGRTKRHHPVEALNNFEMFDRLGTNESLLGLDDELAENKIFASKSALNWVNCDWSVKKNVQCWIQESYKTRLIMKCKEGSCPWRIYVRPKEGSITWGIITNKNSHNCRRPLGDRKHLQLTSNLIAGCVRQYLKKDRSLTVQQISMIIETKYPGMIPTYGKLWRGRERAIEQLFGT